MGDPLIFSASHLFPIIFIVILWYGIKNEKDGKTTDLPGRDTGL